mmetsp:Transcript_13406/g.49800  ORF Transcript_13406/g.49800 Transcript_13406/m.49800 type:complete len:212 (+) Transcript_13406:5988-6623(+)
MCCTVLWTKKPSGSRPVVVATRRSELAIGKTRCGRREHTSQVLVKAHKLSRAASSRMEIFTNPRRSGRSSGISLWPSSGDAYKMVSRQARSSSASAFTVPTLLCTFCPYVRLGSVLRGFFAAALSFGVDLGVAFAPSDSRPVPFPFRLGPRPLPFLPFLPAAFAFAFAEGFVPGFGGFFAPLDDLFVVFGAVFPSAASAAAVAAAASSSPI